MQLNGSFGQRAPRPRMAQMNAIVPWPVSAADGSRVSREIAFVYPGQGGQWPRMAEELLDSSPLFAAQMDECADALAPFADWSPIDVLRGSGEALEAGSPDVVQPVLFSVMVSLTALWRAHGVTPDAVVGHSIGEASAGYVAGALSLADAARVVALVSRVQARLAGRGEMASVMLSATAMRERLARWHDKIAVAAVNGPAAVIISGDRDAVTEEVARLNADGISARLIPLGVAAHSPHIDETEEELREVLAPIAPLTPRIPLYSSLSGGRVAGPMDADYWFRMLREPVKFDPAIRMLLDDGCDVFVEVSPHPVLSGAIMDTADDHSRRDAVVANTLRRGAGNLRYFYTQAAELSVRGVKVNRGTAHGEAHSGGSGRGGSRGGAGAAAFPPFRGRAAERIASACP
jgi:acyl transferase domain-containing protein